MIFAGKKAFRVLLLLLLQILGALSLVSIFDHFCLLFFVSS